MDNIFSFGFNVFDDNEMKKRLTKAAYESLLTTRDSGARLDMDTAQAVAGAMKDWAIEKGATHFCHWFMPLTGHTSEKHDAFLSLNPKGTPIIEFSGKNLIIGESDASSFPSGGLRASFEARGYTTWDCTSPAFVKENSLYIPTAFSSYNGEALDKKVPLLRSMDALNAAGLRLCKLLNIKDVKKVFSCAGAEQEYFLVDRDIYEKRKDLKLCGRTLIGRPPSKRQELHDHYFGSIKTRISNYMADLDKELWKLGVCAHSKHNENAPAQHELAPVYEIANIATDHNYLTMDVMKKVAEKHNLVCLLHEKPFNYINGSGKHNNWSLASDTGINFLEPGKNPEKNLKFLITLACVIKGVDEYADLLRMSVASAGNDHRLGGFEAPPAIISIYLGDEISRLLERINTGKANTATENNKRLNMKSIPEFIIDNSDRNRTSPFAFTGNKFEFRMVGSNMSIAEPNAMINAIVADGLNYFCGEVEKAAGDDIKKAEEISYQLVKNIFTEHKRIIFSGNNYSKEWHDEAKARGLSNHADTVSAIEVLNDKKICEVLVRTSTYTQAELESRYLIMLDNYVKENNIEALTMLELLQRSIMPNANRYLDTLVSESLRMKSAEIENKYLDETMSKVNDALQALYRAVKHLENAAKDYKSDKDKMIRAKFMRDKILPAMSAVRTECDKLEGLVPQEDWPIPSYYDLLYKV